MIEVHKAPMAPKQLAWGVINQLILDLTLLENMLKGERRKSTRTYTPSADPQAQYKQAKAKEESVYRHAADACYCLFDKPVMVDYWLSIVDMPAELVKAYVTKNFPKTCREMLVGSTITRSQQ